MNIKHIYFGLLGICLIALLLRRKKLHSYYLLFIPLLAAGFTTEIFKDVFTEYRYVIQRVYQAIECFLLLMFYYLLTGRPKVKLLIVASYIIYLIATFIHYVVYAQIIDNKDYFDFTIEAFIICVMAALFFFEIMDTNEEMRSVHAGAFYINAVHLLFYGGSFFSMAYYRHIAGDAETPFSLLKTIPHYLNLLLYVVYAGVFAGVLALEKKEKQYG